MEFLSFDYKSQSTPLFIAKSIEKYAKSAKNSMAFIFIGSDCNVGDSLAPLCGSIISVNSGRVFLYGSLKGTITAKEVPYIAEFVKKTHPGTLIVVVDAAVGKTQDIGQIKVQNCGIKPGLGVNKNLPMMGDISIIGVLGEKNAFGTAFGVTRLSVVYQMAKVISEGIEIFIKNNEKELNFASRCG